MNDKEQTDYFNELCDAFCGVLFDNGMHVKIYDNDCKLYAIGKVVGHSESGQHFDVEVAKDQDVYVERYHISKLIRHTGFVPSVVME